MQHTKNKQLLTSVNFYRIHAANQRKPFYGKVIYDLKFLKSKYFSNNM